MASSKIEIWAPARFATPVSGVKIAEETMPGNAADAPFTRQAMASTTIETLRSYQVDMTELADNLKQVLSDFQQVMDGLPQSADGYCIDEIELNMGVNGSGGIALIGRMEVGIEAAIKVKIKRESARPAA